MSQRLRYHGEIVTAPDDLVAGRFKVRLFDGEVEVGLISGYMYLPDSFGIYKQVLDYTDYMDGDEYSIMEIMTELMYEETKRHCRIMLDLEYEIFPVGVATIDRVYIRPEYRGRGYAKEAMLNARRIIADLFEEEYVIMGLIAHVFELDESVSLSDDDESRFEFVKYSDDETLTDKLVSLYESVGFRVAKELHGVGNAKVMVNGI